MKLRENIIDKIKKQIRRYGFKDYLIMRIKKRQNQLYLLERTAESAREVESEQFDITVFMDRKKDAEKLRCSYSFHFKTGENINHHLEQARIGCALVKNRHFSLVAPQKYPEVRTFDEQFLNPHRLIRDVSDLVYTYGPARNVFLSSAEIFISTIDIELHSSTGISANTRNSSMNLEYTLLSRRLKKEEEFNVNFTRRNFDPHYIGNRIIESHEFARDMLRTKIPKNCKGFVTIRAEDIYELFSPIIFHSSARAKDFGISRFELGHPITSKPITGDKVTIMSTGILPYGLYSGSFDREGIAGQQCLVVGESTFRKYWATKQYADYARLRPTGSFKNMAIQKKTGKAIGLPDDAHEIVQFSGLNPDTITGDFVAEIRFGYRLRNGRKIPIKGGSVSGNLFDSLSEMYLSGTSVFEGNYVGPDRIALGNLTIAGN